MEVVRAELLAGILVELAVQLAAVGAAVVLADKAFVPHGIAHDSRLLDQDLLLETVDHLLPAACLDGVVEDDKTVRMRLAPDHVDLAAPLVVDVADRPRFRAGPARAAHQPQRSPEAFGRLPLRLVVLGLGLLERTP